ncbi:hypothetical protein D3C78_1642110 [compost metagenome]
MTALTAIVLLGAHLVDDDLGALAVTDDLAGDLGAGDGRRADGDVAVLGNQEHLIEGDGLVDVGAEQFDLDVAAFFNPDLFAAGGDDGVHEWAIPPRCETRQDRWPRKAALGNRGCAVHAQC